MELRSKSRKCGQADGIEIVKKQAMYMKQEKKATYSFHVSVNGEKTIDMDDLTEEERQKLYQKLCRQYIEKGLGGEIISSKRNSI